MSFEAELEAAVEAARNAASAVRARAGNLSASAIAEKGKNDLVTEADVESQEIIIDLLSSAFPSYVFMAEENDDAPDRRADQWIIDPIDGTTNFVHGLPPYSVSIGLQVGGEIVVAVVLEIQRNELFTAIRGQGCQLNGRPFSTSRVRTTRDAMVATGFPTRDNTMPYLRTYLDVLGTMMRDTQSVRRMGSAAADLAYVACGRFDGFFEIGLSPWDSAAGSLLVHEAGGRVTTFSGGRDFLHGPQVLASNGPIHDELMKMVGPLTAAMGSDGHPTE